MFSFPQITKGKGKIRLEGIKGVCLEVSLLASSAEYANRNWQEGGAVKEQMGVYKASCWNMSQTSLRSC